MSLDISGALLENVRFSAGNSVYTFPPYSLVSDSSAFSGVSSRAEYLVVAGSLGGKKQLEIADPDLVMFWTRNEPGVIRFDYDSFSGRWMPLPGGPPVLVGTLSNSPRLSVSAPDLSIASAPCTLFIDESPRISFLLVSVGSGSFSDPSSIPELTVEINSSGQLNFSSADIGLRSGREVFFTGQNFLKRSQLESLGTVPAVPSAEYKMFLNPKPAFGQIPRVRIGFRSTLQAVSVPTEASFSTPSPGTFQWAEDTGRIKLAPSDISDNPEETTYYEGVFLGQKQLDKFSVSVMAGWPSVSFNLPAAVGNEKSERFVVFAEKTGEARRYFSISVFRSHEGFPSVPPPSGWAYFDIDTGNFFLSSFDVANFSGWSFGCVDARLSMESGVSVQLMRSGANGPGVASVPDFTVVYEVSQVLTDNLDSFPFLMLPTVPLVDSDLSFRSDFGTGKFVGDLADSSDPSKSGPGYILSLGTKQLKYSYRAAAQIYALPVSQSFIKLDGAAIVGRGIEIKRNGTLLSPSEFSIDTSSGLIEFVEPVGEGDPSSIEVSGHASGNKFYASEPVFSSSSGKRLLISSGANAGIYEIESISSPSTVTVFPSFQSEADVSASIRETDEIVVDRFWTAVSSVPKKFSAYRSPSGPAGTFSKIPVGKYSVKNNVGQVSLSDPALPGEAIRIEYVSIDTADDGSTFSTPRIEMALFKIGQEAASFSVGSRTISFNTAGKTVSSVRPPVLYIEGVTQDASGYAFTAPGTIVCKDVVQAGPVTIDYWVEEASGGETTIDLQYSPVDYDVLSVSGPVPGQSGGSTSMKVSGDQTGMLKPLCALLIEDKDVLYIVSSSYDSSSDLTTVEFSHPAVSDGQSIKVTGEIRSPRSSAVFFSSKSPYLIPETVVPEIFVSGTTSLRFRGDVLSSYRQGVIIDLDGDPYLVRGSSYDSSSNTTTVTTAGSARRNYISPVVKRTIRPVVDPSFEFSTSRQAHISKGFVLAKMGTSSSILRNGIDYDLADDGIIRMRSSVSYGDILRAMYVARVSQPVGTVFELNFAIQAAPDSSNGLIGQKLTMNYNLYAPDTFFYRVETVETMLPEAREYALSSSSASASGPNIASLPSQQTKDAGLPSPWYDSTHYANMDVVVQRFLKYYNDLINTYEDILQLLDGRVVGGSSGRFRYDGVLGRVVSSYSQIQNDIDDSVVLYSHISMGPGFPPTVSVTPVYGKMSSPNSLSRLFPTNKTGAAFIGDTSSASAGQPVGSYGISNIASVGTTTTAIASAYFTSSASVLGGTAFCLDATASASGLVNALSGVVPATGTNGDPSVLMPPFAAGQKVRIYSLEGTLISDGVVSSIDSAKPWVITVDGVFTSSQLGIVSQVPADFEGDLNQQNMYTPGIDYVTASDTGQILYFKMPTGFPSQNNPLKGNEVIEAAIAFTNSSMKPQRVPALDGKETNDYGRLPVPRVRVSCEAQKMTEELESLKVGNAKYPSIGVTLFDVSTYGLIKPGSTIYFINGPNTGISTTVSSISGTSMKIGTPLPTPDPSGSDFVVGSSPHAMSSILMAEEVFLRKEIEKTSAAIGSFGNSVRTGTGSALSATEWVDSSFDFVGTEGMLLFVTSGSSAGLYKIKSASGDTVTIDSAYPPLVSGSGSYSVISPLSFLGEAEFLFAAGFYRNTSEFLASTQSWLASASFSGVPNRISSVRSRQSYVKSTSGESGSLTTLLKSGDNLYDTRYMWIDQRTNRETGLVQMWAMAEAKQQETVAKIVDNQRKALMMGSV